MAYIGSYAWKLRQKVGPGLLLLPGATVCVLNPNHEILLLKREDTGLWNTPGGIAEAGGSFLATATRELAEEAHITVRPAELTPFACLSEGRWRYTYPGGAETQGFTMCFLLQDYASPLAASGDETTALAFYSLDKPPQSLFPRTGREIELLQAYLKTRQFQVS